MTTKNNYIKFSSRLDDNDYFTQIDLVLNNIKISKDGVNVYDNTIKAFKEAVADGGWLHHKVYMEILSNGEQLMEIMTKAP